MTPLDPALTCALAHEQRRGQPLPPLVDLLPDDAIATVRAEEARRAGERVNDAYRRAVTP